MQIVGTIYAIEQFQEHKMTNPMFILIAPLQKMPSWINPIDVHDFTNDIIYCISKNKCPHLFDTPATPHVGISKMQGILAYCNAFEQYYYYRSGTFLLNDASSAFFSNYSTFQQLDFLVGNWPCHPQCVRSFAQLWLIHLY